eukprot:sb/3470568/
MRHRKIRGSISNMIFMSLVFVNSCTIVITIPVSIVSRLRGSFPWPLDEDDQSTLCSIFGVVDNTVAVCSIWTLGLYAIDRLMYVMFPLNYHRKITRSRIVGIHTVCVTTNSQWDWKWAAPKDTVCGVQWGDVHSKVCSSFPGLVLARAKKIVDPDMPCSLPYSIGVRLWLHVVVSERMLVLINEKISRFWLEDLINMYSDIT